jgi:hypothetical protein
MAVLLIMVPGAPRPVRREEGPGLERQWRYRLAAATIGGNANELGTALALVAVATDLDLSATTGLGSLATSGMTGPAGPANTTTCHDASPNKR